MVFKSIKYKSEVQTFCDEITLHGFMYIAPSRCILSKIIWICVIIVSGVSAVLVVQTLFNNWSSHPIVTTIDSTSYPVNEIPFPAVTVCPNGNDPWAFVQRVANSIAITPKVRNDFKELFDSPIRTIIIMTDLYVKNEVWQNIRYSLGKYPLAQCSLHSSGLGSCGYNCSYKMNHMTGL
jgi:hypothetical protein